MGLYGLAKEASFYVSAAGILLLLIGVVLLLLATRRMPRSWPNLIMVAVSAVGLSLYLAFGPFRFSSFRLGWLLWASVPYLACIVVSLFSHTRTAAIAGVVAALLFDCYVYYSVWHSTSSTAAGRQLS